MSVCQPADVLDYWIGAAAHDAGALAEKNKLWFVKSAQTDAEIAERFLPTIGQLSAGLAYDWAAIGARERLAAIICLDQFTRNVFRDTPGAFADDAVALGLAKEALLNNEDTTLSEVERVFLYLPIEHSERATDQTLSIDLFTHLSRKARPEFQGFVDHTLEFAHKHKAVIDRFGRYPHRNAILGRETTPEEAAYLAEPGSGF